MIVQDLWPTIVEYVPVTDLKVLSKISPIFDKILCTIGRSVFYQDNEAFNLQDCTLIKLKSGKKYVLQQSDIQEIRYNVVNDKMRPVYTKEISYGNGYDSDDQNVCYDTKSKIMVSYQSSGNVVITKNHKANWYNSDDISVGDDFDRIDLYACVALKYKSIDHSTKKITFTDFTIIFGDNSWQ